MKTKEFTGHFWSILVTLLLALTLLAFASGFFLGIVGVILSAIALGIVTNCLNHHYAFGSGKSMTIFLTAFVSVELGYFFASKLTSGGTITFPTDFMVISGLIIGAVFFIAGWAIIHWADKESAQ